MNTFGRRKFLKNAASTTVGGAISLAAPSSKKAFGGGTELENSPYIIVIHCDGGWDPTLVFNNKLTSSYIDTQTGCSSAQGAGGIPFIHHSDRPAVQSFFDNYGSNAAIINGIYTGSMSHSKSLQYSSGVLVPETNRHVDWMSFYGAQTGLEMPVPHVAIDAPQIPGIYGEYSARLTTAAIAEYRSAVLPIADAVSANSETALTTFLNLKYGKLLENRLSLASDSEKLQDLQGGYLHEAALKAGVLKHTDDASKSDFSNNLNIAVKLLENKYSKCITIQAGADKLWDTHTGNDAAQSANFEMLFSAINEVLGKIQASGSSSPLKNQLTIIVKSELGRAPKLNSALQKGKDHWPFTSALLWGVGINGGKVFGSTDDRLRGLPINPIFGTTDDTGAVPLEMPSIFAALYNLFGIPYTLLLPDTVPASMLLSVGA